VEYKLNSRQRQIIVAGGALAYVKAKS